MTTPMRYLALWFKKHRATDYRFDLETARLLSQTCNSIDFSIQLKIRRELGTNLTQMELSKNLNFRDGYIDFFSRYTSFNELCLSLDAYIENQDFISIINDVFILKFPMEKKKLQKMWNLKPKGIS